MRKVLRILGIVLGVLLIGVLGALVALQSPAAQTWLARKALTRIQEKIDGEVSFSAISVSPFDAVTIKDLAITDPSPYTDGTRAPLDTLLHAGLVSVRFSPWGLLREEGLSISRLRVKDASFNLVFEPDSTGRSNLMNLERIFRMTDDEEDDDDGIHFGRILDKGCLDAENFTFRMVLYPDEGQAWEDVPSNAINWEDLEINADLHVKDISVADDFVICTLEKGRMREKSGFVAHELSGGVRVGKGLVHLTDLHIRDDLSNLYLKELDLAGPLSDYGDFVNRISIDGTVLAPSVLAMQTIRYFAPEVEFMTARFALKGRIQGPVRALRLSNIAFTELDSNVSGQINGRITGLIDTDNTRLDLKAQDMRFTLRELDTFIHRVAGTRVGLGDMAKGTRFNFDGTVSGLLDGLQVGGKLTSSLGAASTNLQFSNLLNSKKPIRMGGTLRTRDLNVGAFIGTQSVGPVSMYTALDATFGEDLSVRIDTLQVSRLRALDYDYTDIAAAGTYSDKAFDGRVVCNDPNLNFIFQGLFNLSPQSRNAAYQFYANVGYADLNALHIDNRGKSRVSFRTDANFVRTQNRDLLGEIRVTGLQLENSAGRHNIGNIAINAHANDNIHRIRFNSGFAEGTFIGEKSLLTLVDDLKDLLIDKELPALDASPSKHWDGTPYDLSFSFHDTRELLSFVLPGLYVEENTALQLKVDKDGTVDAALNSGRVALGGSYIKDLQLTLDNKSSALRAELNSRLIHTAGGLELRNNSATLFGDDNHVGLGFNFDNETELDNRGELYLSGDLERSGEDLILTAQALPSNLYYNGEGWSLHSGDIVLGGDGVRVDQFVLQSSEQQLTLDGGYSQEKTDTLRLRMEKFDISLLNSLIGQDLNLQGLATGRAMAISPAKPSIGMLAGIVCDSTYIAGERVGQLNLLSVWNEPENRFDFAVRNRLNNKSNLDVHGFLRPSDKALSADATLDRLNLGYASPFLTGLFRDFGGFLSGKIHVGGSLDAIKIQSEGLEVIQGGAILDYTQVFYAMEGPVSLTEKMLSFNPLHMSDGKGGTGEITGGLLLNGFKDIALDTHIKVDGMQVLHLGYGDNSNFWGDIFANGRVDVGGSLGDIDLDIDMTTVGDGTFHIPLDGSGSFSSRNFLTFVEPAVDLPVDPYEEMLGMNLASAGESETNINLRLRVRATPAVRAFIDIGDNTLNGLGNGLMDIETRTSEGSFTINGDYTLSQGSFHFSAMNLVSRDFTIRDGSSVRFNGDIMNTDLDVDGVYTTKVPLSNLIADSTSVSRRTVECGILITDKLSEPKVKLSINIPDLDPTTQGLVESALNTEDKVQKQFVYLLVANNFLPTEESGITNASGSLYGSVAGIMAGQLSSIFQKLNIPLDLGFNYQSDEKGNDLFDVALSTQLFMGRVIVNGNIGNRKYYAGAGNTQEITGDLDVEIKLDKPGTLRLNLFSHSADQYTSYLDNSQRNGAGLVYQREFNTFQGLFQSLFQPKKAQEERLKAPSQVRLTLDPEGKTHPVDDE